MVTVNVVVLAGTVSADPVQRRMPSGDEVTELRLSVPETGKRLLPFPVAAWHARFGARRAKRQRGLKLGYGSAVAMLPTMLPEDRLVGRASRVAARREHPHLPGTRGR